MSVDDSLFHGSRGNFTRKGGEMIVKDLQGLMPSERVPKKIMGRIRVENEEGRD